MTDTVGVIPAAGRATRSAPLPCSKEIFPVGFEPVDDAHPAVLKPRPACGYLLEAMRRADAPRAHVVVNPGKADVPAYLGDGAAYGLALSYLTLQDSPGVPWTVRRALTLAGDARVLFGFPDIVFRPPDALQRLCGDPRAADADVALGLFPARQPHKMDMVAVDDDGRLAELVIKPPTTTLTDTWILATWTVAFSDYLTEFVDRRDAGERTADGGEVHLGHVIRAAAGDGLDVVGVRIPDGAYRDIGTPDELVAAVREFG